MNGLSEEARKEVYEILLRFSQYGSDRNRAAYKHKGKTCKNCDKKLNAEDLLNSFYGAYYLLCKKCASKISI